MTNSKIFPTLFNQTKNGKVKQWTISVNEHSVINTKTGFVDGKMTTFEVEITKGKNIGKTNETTTYQQAIFEAESKWKKKNDAGYTINESGIVKTLVFPMLAMNFEKDFKKIDFPNVLCQPKLDGIRAVFENGCFHSRKLKLFPHLEHLENELKNVKHILDGELYSDVLPFQVISGIVRKETLNDIDHETIKHIQFRVYDIVNKDSFEKRYDLIKTFFQNNIKNFKYIHIVETSECKNAQEAKEKHDLYVKNGYEGLMLRNKNGKYEENSRSYNLQKYKSFDDSEYEVVSFKDGVGKEKDAVIWILKTLENKTFDARPIGSITERKRIFKIANQYIGTFITIKHFGLTDDKIPRFPISQLLPRID